MPDTPLSGSAKFSQKDRVDDFATMLVVLPLPLIVGEGGWVIVIRVVSTPEPGIALLDILDGVLAKVV